MKYRGNLDPSLILQTEFETKLVWCRLENNETRINNGQPRYKIVCYTSGVWNGFLKNEQKHNIIFWKLGEFVSCQILHDPSLNIKPEKLAV